MQTATPLASLIDCAPTAPFVMTEIPWSIVLRERTGWIEDDFYLMEATPPNREAIAFVPMFTNLSRALRFIGSLGDEGRKFSAFRPKIPADFATMLEKLREAEMGYLAFDFEPGKRTSIAPLEQILEGVRKLTAA